MKYCTSCGKELFDEAVICPQCGASQMPKAPEAQPQTVAEEKAVKPESAVNEFFEKKKKSKKPLIIIIAAIVALAVAAAVVFLVIKPFGGSEDESSLILDDVISAYSMTEAEIDTVDALYDNFKVLWGDMKKADIKTNDALMEFTYNVYVSWTDFYENTLSDFAQRINGKENVSQELRDLHADIISKGFVLEVATGYGKDHLNNAVALINSFSNLFYAEELISAKEVEDFLAPKTQNVIDGLNEYLLENFNTTFAKSTSGNTITGSISEYGYEVVIEEKDGIVSSIRISIPTKKAEANVNTEYARMCRIACAMTFQKPEIHSDMYNTLVTEQKDFTLGGWEYEIYRENYELVFNITMKY